ncbi:MAG: hypothetical protein PF518_10890 [Spirochaetaceae bacterium]|jgi:hypothetical protein|nr:hypothetical protein [Spirochaetaceae bacterium]
MILTANICSCKILDIPPLGQNELENIIRYKLTSFYPGSVDELEIDYIRSKERVIVFYISRNKLDILKNGNPNIKFYSSYHLLEDLLDKQGTYCLPLENRLEILNFTGNKLTDLFSIPFSEENLFLQKNENAVIIEKAETNLTKVKPLFQKRRQTDYTIQILLFFTLMLLIPQIFLSIQKKYDELYLQNLEIELNTLVLKNNDVFSMESKLNKLKSQYESLRMNKPLNIYTFLSDLSLALGSDTEIDSLVLKDQSFRLNATGYKPLEKMEKFQKNPGFQSVIPYQVQSIPGTSREKFSLTGFYFYE